MFAGSKKRAEHRAMGEGILVANVASGHLFTSEHRPMLARPRQLVSWRTVSRVAQPVTTWARHDGSTTKSHLPNDRGGNPAAPTIRVVFPQSHPTSNVNRSRSCSPAAPRIPGGPPLLDQFLASPSKARATAWPKPTNKPLTRRIR